MALFHNTCFMQLNSTDIYRAFPLCKTLHKDLVNKKRSLTFWSVQSIMCMHINITVLVVYNYISLI